MGVFEQGAWTLWWVRVPAGSEEILSLSAWQPARFARTDLPFLPLGFTEADGALPFRSSGPGAVGKTSSQPPAGRARETQQTTLHCPLNTSTRDRLLVSGVVTRARRDGLKIPHTKIVQVAGTHVPKSHLVSEFTVLFILFTD